jgi:hypothetical protein
VLTAAAETAQIPEEIPRFLSCAAFARLAGVSSVAISKAVRKKLAPAYADGLIDRESTEAVQYLQNRTATRTALPLVPLCREIISLRAALKRWQQARAAAAQTEAVVLVAAQHVLDRFGGVSPLQAA